MFLCLSFCFYPTYLGLSAFRHWKSADPRVNPALLACQKFFFVERELVAEHPAVRACYQKQKSFSFPLEKPKSRQHPFLLPSVHFCAIEVPETAIRPLMNFGTTSLACLLSAQPFTAVYTGNPRHNNLSAQLECAFRICVARLTSRFLPLLAPALLDTSSPLSPFAGCRARQPVVCFAIVGMG